MPAVGDDDCLCCQESNAHTKGIDSFGLFRAEKALFEYEELVFLARSDAGVKDSHGKLFTLFLHKDINPSIIVIVADCVVNDYLMSLFLTGRDYTLPMTSQ